MVFTMDNVCVLCEVENETSHIIQINVSLQKWGYNRKVLRPAVSTRVWFRVLPLSSRKFWDGCQVPCCYCKLVMLHPLSPPQSTPIEVNQN